MNRLVVVGDSLLDRDVEGSVERLCPDAPVPVVDEPRSRARPGGAALAAALAARSGRLVTLVTPIAQDAGGEELRALLRDADVDVVALETQAPTAEKIRIRAGGRTLLRIDRGERDPASITASHVDLGVLARAAVLVSDYGSGVTRNPYVREAMASSSCVVWDPHPRGATPVAGCRLVTPNRAEAGLAVRASIAEISARARELAREWHAEAVAVTLGADGALLSSALGAPLAIPAPRVAVGDTCGAGDSFAATAAGLIADGASPGEAVTGAVVAASSFVAAGSAAQAILGQRRPQVEARLHGIDAARRMIAETRARGGRVVATGGCFDILHAGHVASLRAARALGGCLVVCLNSDASVRRLKGPSRPVVAERDRVEVLTALACVDAVVVFDEATPEALLRELRPDVFVKGGDYELAAMPEAQLVRSWGGEAVLVPYLEGYSTSGLLAEARRAG
jgi:rfaE bifunctional protein nucleotidyltransferase chain/domain/rfaE bifunctional protein kinase chain/domain